VAMFSGHRHAKRMHHDHGNRKLVIPWLRHFNSIQDDAVVVSMYGDIGIGDPIIMMTFVKIMYICTAHSCSRELQPYAAIHLMLKCNT
jgi:hypothetical protein